MKYDLKWRQAILGPGHVINADTVQGFGRKACVIESMLLYKLVHISLHVSKFTFAFTDVENIYTMLHPQIVTDAGLEAVHQ